MCYALCLLYHSSTEAGLFAGVSSAGPPQRVDCLAPKWETGLSVFPKDTVMRYRIGSRTKVLQPFDYQPGENKMTLSVFELSCHPI